VPVGDPVVIEGDEENHRRGLGDDLAITCLSDARSSIAKLLGIDVTENLLDTVFSKFCVGK
jgi:tRNA modification GTPase